MFIFKSRYTLSVPFVVFSIYCPCVFEQLIHPFIDLLLIANRSCHISYPHQKGKRQWQFIVNCNLMNTSISFILKVIRFANKAKGLLLLTYYNI